MFLLSKNITPLIFAVIILALNLYYQNPYGNGKIAKNTAVHILPIPTSTVFYVTKEPQKVEILGENKGFYKIMLSGSKIGWIKKDEIVKD